MYSIDLVAIPTIIPQTKAPSLEQQVKALTKAREEAIVAHELSRARMKRR
jgi:hypothetical protein